MAGIAVTLAVGAAPQSGTQTVKCSAPANLAAVEAVIDADKVLLAVTDVNGEAQLLGVSRIVSIVAI